jgi:hypothetical protein
MSTKPVHTYQTQLREVGFPIAADGKNGPQTRQAVRFFQEAWTYENLAIDGIYGPRTANALDACITKGGRISDHFWMKEAKSKGNGWPRFNRELVRGLEKLRASKGGKPITANSIYRDPAHNRRVGGATNSQHLYGRAADIGYAYGLTLTQARNLRVFTGIGYHIRSRRVMHVDVRPGISVTNPTTWTYTAGNG